MNDTIKLPAGHQWEEVKHAPAAETWFQCHKCGASFVHDMIDNSTEYDDGAGDCDEVCFNCGSGLFNGKGECQKCGL